MQITVTIPDHLAHQAQARGLQLDRRLAELLAEELTEENQTAAPVLSEDEAAIGRRQRAVDRIRALRQGNLLGGLSIKDLVAEGRKY